MFPKPKRIKDIKAIKAAKRDWCEVCGSDWELQVHHIKAKGSGGHDVPENLICLCGNCHSKAHNGNLSKSFLFEIRRKHAETG